MHIHMYTTKYYGIVCDLQGLERGGEVEVELALERVQLQLHGDQRGREVRGHRGENEGGIREVWVGNPLHFHGSH